MPFLTAFWNYSEVIRNYVGTIRKYHSNDLLRSRSHRPGMRSISQGHICAYVLPHAQVTYALFCSPRAQALLRTLVKQGHVPTKFQIFLI